jgi:cell division protein FtsB
VKWVIAILISLLLLLQFRLWVGDGGIPEVLHLEQELDAAKQEQAQLEERNNELHAEVSDLKQGLDAIEERARSELGMIGKDETFYQILDTPDADQASSKP